MILRILILTLMLVTASSIAGAQKSAVGILQEKPNNSSKTGVWNEKRMARYEGFELAFFGQRFLRGEDIDPNRHTAEILFEAAARKDPSMTSMIGGYYLDNDNKATALKWFTRGMKTGDKYSLSYLGFFMNWTGREILKKQNPTDPPNSEALSLLYAAQHFGYDAQSIVFDAIYYQAGPKILSSAKKQSQKE